MFWRSRIAVHSSEAGDKDENKSRRFRCRLYMVLQDDGAPLGFFRQRRRKRPSDWFADDERGAAIGACLCPIDKNEMCAAERINQTGRRIDDERGASDDEGVCGADGSDSAVDNHSAGWGVPP